jgi:hypothetical protein
MIAPFAIAQMSGNVCHIAYENGVICRGTRRLGDVDGDGEITINDALEILKFLAGLDSAIAAGMRGECDFAFYAAMIHPDSTTPQINDALEILKFLAGLPNHVCGHNWRRITELPTCARWGRIFDRCTVCRLEKNVDTSAPPTGQCNWQPVPGAEIAATCTTPRLRREECGTCSGWRDFRLSEPLGHDYIQNICHNSTNVWTNINGVRRNVTCGKVNTNDPEHFEYYMFRTEICTTRCQPQNCHLTPHARNVLTGWSTGHRGIDIVTGVSGVRITDWPIYAQGTGTVVDRSRETHTDNRGHYITVEYDNDYRAWYLHLNEQPGIEENAGEASKVTHTTEIGRAGNSGAENTSAGHLHYEVHRISNGNSLDPVRLFPGGTFN